MACDSPRPRYFNPSASRWERLSLYVYLSRMRQCCAICALRRRTGSGPNFLIERFAQDLLEGARKRIFDPRHRHRPPQPLVRIERHATTVPHSAWALNRAQSATHRAQLTRCALSALATDLISRLLSLSLSLSLSPLSLSLSVRIASLVELPAARAAFRVKGPTSCAARAHKCKMMHKPTTTSLRCPAIHSARCVLDPRTRQQAVLARSRRSWLPVGSIGQ